MRSVVICGTKAEGSMLIIKPKFRDCLDVSVDVEIV
jgi:hypothetical protein